MSLLNLCCSRQTTTKTYKALLPKQGKHKVSFSTHPAIGVEVKNLKAPVKTMVQGEAFMVTSKEPSSRHSSISRTSQAVALIRSSLDRPHTAEGDADAQKRLCSGIKPVSATRLRPEIIARTRFFDGQVLSALSAGIRQVVICGAGLDDRALRFRTAGVRFFELDQPVTQADKARRLESICADMKGLTLVPVDFRYEDAAAKLEASGHGASQPSLFMCEGLLIYLTEHVGSRLLAALRSRAPAGSMVAASLAIRREGGNSDRILVGINAQRRAGLTEPWVTALPLDAYLALLKQSGWQVACTTDPSKVYAKVVRSGMILITAVPA